jgi:hypothetical protein
MGEYGVCTGVSGLGACQLRTFNNLRRWRNVLHEPNPATLASLCHVTAWTLLFSFLVRCSACFFVRLQQSSLPCPSPSFLPALAALLAAAAPSLLLWRCDLHAACAGLLPLLALQ